MKKMKKMKKMKTDVVIIGAGNAGLQLANNVIKQGLSVIILESRDTVGGVFAFSDNPDIFTVNVIASSRFQGFYE